eukprot:186382-Hanusia_phi.AAC.1
MRRGEGRSPGRQRAERKEDEVLTTWQGTEGVRASAEAGGRERGLKEARRRRRRREEEEEDWMRKN